MTQKTIAVLGDANVGKSTLLNALVVGDFPLLPSAGVGPVTGVTVRMQFSATQGTTIRYRDPRRIYELAFALEHHDHRLGGRAVPERDYQNALPVEVRKALKQGAGTVLNHLVQLCSLLVFGGADRMEPLPVIRAGMRALLGLPRIPNLPACDLDPTVAFRIRQLLSSQMREVRFALELDDLDARERLTSHISGALSVLTDEVVIGWPAPLLEPALRLVDLPGVGIAFDPHQDVTRRYIELECDGLMIVCGRGGISEPCQRMLLSSNILSRLMAAWDPSRPNIIVVVTKLDDEAQQSRRQATTTKRNASGRSLLDYFGDHCKRIVPVMHSQLAWLLAGATSAPSIDVSTIPVVPVAAPSFMGLLAADPDLSTFFKSPEQTNIPTLTRLLGTLGSSCPNPKSARDTLSETRSHSVQQRSHS